MSAKKNKIEICTIGGFEEVGKNCVAVKVDDEVVIFDLGLHLPSYIDYTQGDEDDVDVSPFALTRVGAVPDLKPIKGWKSKTKAIVSTHAHLDHIGGIPYLGKKFKNADIICSPFTAAVLDKLYKDKKISSKNKIIRIKPNSKHKISDKLTIELIYVTHSTPQATIAALHTPYGIIVYANDFKFDDFPTLGPKTNYDRLKKLGEKGVIVAIMDSVNSKKLRKTPSESVADEMLRDVMLGMKHEDKAVMVTTFSSHIARLKSIVKYAKKMNRKIIFLGRSLSKYAEAAEEVGLVKFSDDVEMVKFGSQIRKRVKRLKNPKEYVIVCTGHQAEPKSVLSKMINGVFDFLLKREDSIIFSCKIIPVEENIIARKELEEKLVRMGVRIFKDLHASGHASREELRDFLKLVQPKHLIPSHGERALTGGSLELAKELGYSNKYIHYVKDGEKLEFEALEDS
ncbi:RNase J family beta-CASP ribonuclease [Nanoarchaeota archaeon]